MVGLLACKTFCALTLNYNLVVCGIPNLIELHYSLAYKERFSIYVVLHIWYGLSVKCIFGICVHLHWKI